MVDRYGAEGDCLMQSPRVKHARQRRAERRQVKRTVREAGIESARRLRPPIDKVFRSSERPRPNRRSGYTIPPGNCIATTLMTR